MLSKLVQNNSKNLVKVGSRMFSHGPYNPMHYKTVLVPEGMPTTEDYYATIKSTHSTPPPPIYNMRHIHPVR
jgi:hypothetical protein